MIHISEALREIATDPTLPEAHRQTLTALARQLAGKSTLEAERTLKRWRSRPGHHGSALDDLTGRAVDLQSDANADARWATPPDSFWEPPASFHS